MDSAVARVTYVGLASSETHFGLEMFSTCRARDEIGLGQGQAGVREDAQVNG